MGNDITLNIGERYSQDDPSVAALANGNFVAVWTDSESDPGFDGFTGIVGGVFDPGGRPVGGQFRVNVDPRGQEFAARVTASGNGFTVAWSATGPDAAGNDDPYIDLYMRRFDATGRALGGEVQIDGREKIDHRVQDIATLSDGSVVVLTASSFLRTDWDLTVHRFAADGTRIGTPRVLHQDTDTGTGGILWSTPGATITPLSGGDYLLTFFEEPRLGRPDGSQQVYDRALFGQRFQADGRPAGELNQITPRHDDLDLTLDREFAHATRLGDGRVAMSWTVDPFDIDRNPTTFVEFRIVSESGRPLTPIVRVDGSMTDGDHEALDITALGGGYSLVTFTELVPGVGESYEDWFGINGRIFAPNGKPLGASFAISEFLYEDATGGGVTQLANGSLVFAWQGNASIEEDVFATIVNGGGLSGVRLGSRRDDAIAGRPGSDLVLAGAGHDTVNGGAGNDALFGEAGADSLTGGDGADRLVGGDGRDVLRGNTGGDRLDGGASADTLVGGEGADTIDGGPGIDVLSGGPGNDRFLFGPGDLGAQGGAVERITDVRDGDVIDLSAIDAIEGTGRNDAFDFIGGRGFSGADGELRFAGGVLLGDTDGDRRADIALRAAGVGADDLVL